jgi:diguanylate cyclase (GGDEF)-like protein/PAS domain S-box-containing protein
VAPSPTVRHVHYLARLALLAGVYWATAELGLSLGSLPGNVAPVWPPTGVALAAILLFGTRMWPGVALGALLVNGPEVPLISALGMALGNTAEALVGAWLLRRVHFRPTLDRLRDVVRLVVLGAVVATTASATIGVASLVVGGVVPGARFWSTWQVWWAGDAMGSLLVTPALLTWWDRADFRSRSRWKAEAALLLAGVVAVTFFVFSAGSSSRPYLVLPLVAWAAIRFSVRGAAMAALAASVVAVLHTAAGVGPLAIGTPARGLWLLDAFLGVVAVTGLVLAAVVRERDHAQDELRDVNRDLEGRVTERTEALARDRQRLAEAQRIASIGSWEWNVGANTIIWSDELFRIFGVDPADFDGTYDGYLAAVHPEDRQLVADTVGHAYASGAPFEFDHRVLRPDGRVRWVRGRGAVDVDEAGSPVRMWGTAQDFTDRRRAEEQFRELLEAAPDAMIIVGGDGRIVFVNRQAERLFGWKRDELVGQLIEVLLPERFRHAHGQHREGYFSDPVLRPMGAALELFGLRANGDEFPVEISLSPITTDDDVFVSAAVRDISDRKQAQAQLAHQALHDGLTGLPNRVLLGDRLGQALVRSSRTGDKVAVLFIDVDRFKLVNDSRGHATGDTLLVTVAERLRQAVRARDTVARFGGDEFAVICEDPAAGWAAGTIAERIFEALQEPFLVEGQEIFLSVSIGVAMGGGSDSPEGLLSDADAAMYRAKDQGRARHEFFDETMRTEAAARLDTESALHRAIEREELRVFYQPIVDLHSGMVTGVEALVRWMHPQRGLVSPLSFIPLAEETGLIVPIGQWVLEEAAGQMARWRDARGGAPLDLSVNLAARQLRQPRLADSVQAVLTRAGLDPSCLYLELTESSFMEDSEFHGSALFALKSLGVQLAIDDFGTGYSSLTYLKRFPLNVVKIDQSFVRGLGEDACDTAIVESVIDLAHALGLKVVAEGVETRRQVAELLVLGCDLAQGFFFARPEPPEALDELLHPGAVHWPALRRSCNSELRSRLQA